MQFFYHDINDYHVQHLELAIKHEARKKVKKNRRNKNNDKSKSKNKKRTKRIKEIKKIKKIKVKTKSKITIRTMTTKLLKSYRWRRSCVTLCFRKCRRFREILFIFKNIFCFRKRYLFSIHCRFCSSFRSQRANFEFFRNLIIWYWRFFFT